eukprot:280833-Pyramimonas_sp.AAC.1
MAKKTQQKRAARHKRTRNADHITRATLAHRTTTTSDAPGPTTATREGLEAQRLPPKRGEGQNFRRHCQL